MNGDKRMNIGNLTFEKNIFLSPLAGVSEVGFRKVCELCGAEFCVSEMVSAKAMHYGSKKTNLLVNFPENCRYRVVQIFGSDKQAMVEAVQNLNDKCDIIDINMGCPAPKVFKNGDGCALMGNIDLARDIIASCVKASKVPITVKFRSGIDDEHINAVQFALMCEQCGVSAITLHARTREQFYSGKADLNLIKEVVKSVKIPVIGNGDIVDKASYKAMLDTGCAGVMIGRGALGNPFIFCELLGEKPLYTKKQLIVSHIQELQKYFEDLTIAKHMRKHLLWYVSSVANSKMYKEAITKCCSTKQIFDLLDIIIF